MSPRPVLKKIWKLLKGQRNQKPWTRASSVRMAETAIAKFPLYADAPRHGLSAPLIVSLTSYPPRFPSLHLALKSLLDQTVRPDKIVLWIAEDDVGQLPDTVTNLLGDTLVVRTCEDIRNFKRIVPAMDAYPDSFLIFVDDDMFYPEEWLQRLVDAYDPNDPTVVCYRASRVGRNPDGSLTPYRTWRNAGDRKAEMPSTDLLPINQMGVLYPPGSLPPVTKDYDLIQKLSPTSDEVWLFYMWRHAGWRVKRVPGKMPAFAEWPGTQEQALWRTHRGGKKDDHFRTMYEYFEAPREPSLAARA